MKPRFLVLALVLVAVVAAGAMPACAHASFLSESIADGKSWLSEHDVELSLDAAFFEEYASRTIDDVAKDTATFAWLLTGDWRFLESERFGNTHFDLTLLGSVGLGYDTATNSLGERVGTISGLNNVIYPDGFAVDEVYFKQVLPKDWLVLEVGILDMTYYFDTNAAANNGFTQFFSFAFEDNLSIPFPVYGGLGVRGTLNLWKSLYVMAAASESSSTPRTTPWETFGAGSWWELLEIGVRVEVGSLGKGTYRLIPWHNRISGGGGFGVGLNFEQNLASKRLTAFGRFGIGDPAETAVKGTASLGLSFADPFAREGDAVAGAVSWADPSDPGPSETFLELFYLFNLTDEIGITPDLQVIVNPSGFPDADVVLVGGVRLVLAF